MRSKRMFTASALAAAALLMGACGDDESSDGGGGGSSSGAAASSTVSLRSIDGAEVLVDSEGSALYTSEQEEDGKVRCTAGCAAIWLPLAAPSGGEPTAGSDVSGELGVVKRPDGTRQVTLDGIPLYRFADDDGPGRVSGDGLSDSFDGRQFTWHVEGSGNGDEPGAEPSESSDPYGSY